MWMHEMTDEQKRAYGFVDLSIEEMERIGYRLVKSGRGFKWKKVYKRGLLRMWQGS